MHVNDIKQSNTDVMRIPQGELRIERMVDSFPNVVKAEIKQYKMLKKISIMERSPHKGVS